jgi:hypothetical protein
MCKDNTFFLNRKNPTRKTILNRKNPTRKNLLNHKKPIRKNQANSQLFMKYSFSLARVMAV